MEETKEQTLRAMPRRSDDLALKEDHEARACYVCHDGTIYVDMRSPTARVASAFLTAIAEPVSRPEFFHEFTLTAYSLQAGFAVSLDTESILSTLNKLCKHVLPSSVVDFIRYYTETYGKARLVLKRKRMFMESDDEEIMQQLLAHEVIRTARVLSSLPEATDRGEGSSAVYVEVDPGKVGLIKRIATGLNYPMLEEYAYDEDDINSDLEMHLRADVQTRPHQDKALSKMFYGGRARSGVIVLPCGAGKTLTGISAACTIHKSTLVVCSNTVACMQWMREFLKFTTLRSKDAYVFTGDPSSSSSGAFPVGAMVLLTTYSMIGMDDENRKAESLAVMEKIRAREWGLLVLDEVHMVAAATFRTTVDKIQAHCKLGLTATLVREDDQIGDLNYLVGPKLYEADWMDLTAQGYIAQVQCVEVQCPMTPLFMKAYVREDEAKKHAIYVMNPNKYLACKHLMDYHEGQGDKVLVFSDTVASVHEYSVKLHRFNMHGKTGTYERNMLLARFRLKKGEQLYDPEYDNGKDKEGKEKPKGKWLGSIETLVLSKVGDVAIDLPEASVLIQVSSHFASRRQEAQRVGRILRPKGQKALFYSLVSMDTKEAVYNQKRKSFLVNQGYAYKTITWEMLFDGKPPPIMPDGEQHELLKIAKTDKLKT